MKEEKVADEKIEHYLSLFGESDPLAIYFKMRREVLQRLEDILPTPARRAANRKMPSTQLSGEPVFSSLRGEHDSFCAVDAKVFATISRSFLL